MSGLGLNTGGGGIVSGSSMLSPTIASNPFSLQSNITNPGVTFEWLSPPKNTSPATDKRNSNHITSSNIGGSSINNCGLDKKSLSSCRYQQTLQGQTASDSHNFMSLFNSGLSAETVLGRSFAEASSVLQQHHLVGGSGGGGVGGGGVGSGGGGGGVNGNNVSQQSSQHHQISSHPTLSSAGSQLYSSHFSTPAAAAPAGPSPYHLQQGHGLPSPTIYPPTPPPSAPWIHPWYAGDTF